MAKMPEGVLVAVIAAVSAISGTVVGGVVTYLGNQSLQTHELSQEVARQTTAARAVARILMSDYQTDLAWLLLMTSGEQYEPASYREHVFINHIGQEDRKLLAGRLSEHEWTEISLADRDIEDVEADLEQHHGHGTIGEEGIEALQRARTACETAYDALGSLAEGQAAS